MPRRAIETAAVQPAPSGHVSERAIFAQTPALVSRTLPRGAARSSYCVGRTVSSGTKLTTTSYALLGLLAIRPWTTYELTQQMQRSLSRFWPRAASKLYEEPKKLAAHGLATATTERIGERSRARYTIAAEGRRELARWLAQPAQDPVLELEFLVKVFLAEHGTKGDLLSTLSGVTQWAQQQADADAEIASSYLTGQGRFPERTAQLVLVGRYLSDFADMTARWAEWATAVVEEWPDDPSQRVPAWDALQDVVRRARPDQVPPAPPARS